MLFPSRKKPRRFSYSPQYLKEKKGGEGKESKIKFKRFQRSSQKRGFTLWIIILMVIVIFIIFYLKRI